MPNSDRYRYRSHATIDANLGNLIAYLFFEPSQFSIPPVLRSFKTGGYRIGKDQIDIEMNTRFAARLLGLDADIAISPRGGPCPSPDCGLRRKGNRLRLPRGGGGVTARFETLLPSSPALLPPSGKGGARGWP